LPVCKPPMQIYVDTNVKSELPQDGELISQLELDDLCQREPKAIQWLPESVKIRRPIL
jgi:hypothetical protein